MKKILSIASIFLFMGIAAPSFAQDTKESGVKKGVKKAWKGTKKGAKKVGNETAELASKGKAKVTDKTSAEWVGPAGQTIYVDDGRKYYWVNGKGKKMYVSESALKAKNNR